MSILKKMDWKYNDIIEVTYLNYKAKLYLHSKKINVL